VRPTSCSLLAEGAATAKGETLGCGLWSAFQTPAMSPPIPLDHHIHGRQISTRPLGLVAAGRSLPEALISETGVWPGTAARGWVLAGEPYQLLLIDRAEVGRLQPCFAVFESSPLLAKNNPDVRLLRGHTLLRQPRAHSARKGAHARSAAR